MKRSCQRQTQVFDLPVRRMISLVPTPSALNRTISARQTCLCGVLRSRASAFRRRSSRDTSGRCSTGPGDQGFAVRPHVGGRPLPRPGPLPPEPDGAGLDARDDDTTRLAPGIAATLRISKGQDIAAGCGQLKVAEGKAAATV